MLPRTQLVLALWLFLLLAASGTHSDRAVLVFRIPSQYSLLEKTLHGEICHLGQKFLNFLSFCLLYSASFFFLPEGLKISVTFPFQENTQAIDYSLLHLPEASHNNILFY